MNDISTENKTNYNSLKKLIISSLMLAIGLIIRQMSVMVPLMGVPGLRIGFSGVFTSIPAIIFGPVYGALTSSMADIVGHFLNPQGPFFPHFTIMAAIGGFLRGFLWMKLRRVSLHKLKVSLSTFLIILISLGIISSIMVYGFSESSFSSFLTGLKIKSGSQIACITYIPIIIGALGFLILYINKFITSKNDNSLMNQKYLPLAITMLISGLIVTTINTEIIMSLYGIKKAFLLFYIPRFIEEVVTNLVSAYLISWILIRTKMEKFLL